MQADLIFTCNWAKGWNTSMDPEPNTRVCGEMLNEFADEFSDPIVGKPDLEICDDGMIISSTVSCADAAHLTRMRERFDCILASRGLLKEGEERAIAMQLMPHEKLTKKWWEFWK